MTAVGDQWDRLFERAREGQRILTTFLVGGRGKGQQSAWSGYDVVVVTDDSGSPDANWGIQLDPLIKEAEHRERWASDAPGTLFVTIGLPGSGKTTRAKELAAKHSAIRLTPDEWMIPLFNHNDADGKRDVLEGRFVWLAMQALKHGTNVVLDFGVWTKDERSALKHLARTIGAKVELFYTPIDPDEQLRRVNERFARTPETTFVITEDDLKQWRTQFQEPDEQELLSSEPGPPPTGLGSWEAWTASRWPTSLDDAELIALVRDGRSVP